MSNANDAERYEIAVRAQRAFTTENPFEAVPQGYITADGFPLGNFCAKRRQDKKAGRLSAEKERELTEAGMIWEPRRAQFTRGVDEWRQFTSRNSACGQVPVRYVSPTGFNLGVWCHTQRVAHKRGALTPEQVQLLTETGFSWEPRLGGAHQRGLL